MKLWIDSNVGKQKKSFSKTKFSLVGNLFLNCVYLNCGLNLLTFCDY